MQKKMFCLLEIIHTEIINMPTFHNFDIKYVFSLFELHHDIVEDLISLTS